MNASEQTVRGASEQSPSRRPAHARPRISTVITGALALLIGIVAAWWAAASMRTNAAPSDRRVADLLGLPSPLAASVPAVAASTPVAVSAKQPEVAPAVSRELAALRSADDRLAAQDRQVDERLARLESSLAELQAARAAMAADAGPSAPIRPHPQASQRRRVGATKPPASPAEAWLPPTVLAVDSWNGMPSVAVLQRIQELTARLQAVKGMLPKGPLGYAMIKKLKVYGGAEHPHTAQQPKPLEI